MKRLILLLLSVSMATSCQLPEQTRPFEAGMTRTSLAASLSSSDLENDFGDTADVDTLAVAASYGSFVDKALEFGGELEYLSEDYEDSFGMSGDLEAISLSVYGRYYFLTEGSQRPFAELALGAGTVEQSGADGDLTRVSLGVGAVQMLSDSAGLEFVLRYAMTTIDVDGFETDQDTLSLFFGYSVFL